MFFLCISCCSLFQAQKRFTFSITNSYLFYITDLSLCRVSLCGTKCFGHVLSEIPINCPWNHCYATVTLRLRQGTGHMTRSPYKWWIKDFPDEGRQSTRRGCQPIIWPNFPQKLHENEKKNWTRGRGEARPWCPFRSANAFFSFMGKMLLYPLHWCRCPSSIWEILDLPQDMNNYG